MKKPGVYITRKESDAINHLISQGWTSKTLLTHNLGLVDPEGYARHLEESLNTITDMNFDSLAIALYDSYEVEKTPVEKLVEYFQRMDNDTAEDSVLVAKGVYETLKILGIEVKGINK